MRHPVSTVSALKAFSGRADDVVGEARGEAAGNALRWRHVRRLSVGQREFGIRLGEVTLSFRKRQ